MIFLLTFLLKNVDNTHHIQYFHTDVVYHYTINDENHTIGNLLQNHISRRCIDDKSMFLLCGYKKTHPKMKFSFKVFNIKPCFRII